MVEGSEARHRRLVCREEEEEVSTKEEEEEDTKRGGEVYCSERKVKAMSHSHYTLFCTLHGGKLVRRESKLREIFADDSNEPG